MEDLANLGSSGQMLKISLNVFFFVFFLSLWDNNNFYSWCKD